MTAVTVSPLPVPPPPSTSEGQTVTLFGEEPLCLDGGRAVTGVRVRYHAYGTPAEHAILVLHALTGTSAVHEWWEALFGPGKALDPSRDFIVCSNVLGGCAGSSEPAELAAGGPLPALTLADMVRVQRRLLEHLGVRRVTVVGGSMGGLNALEWLRSGADLLERAVVVAAPARHSPWAIGLNHAARAAIRAAPGGKGLEVARQIAMLSYRSPESLAARQSGESAQRPGQPAVVTYLEHHGDKLRRRFCEDSYLTLTEAMDRFAPSDAELAANLIPTLVVGISSDVLYPEPEVRALARGLGGAEYWRLDSPHGHDAFLIDADGLNARVKDFLASGQMA